MAKGPDAFRTISEASEEVGVAQHVLRYWESKFALIRPMKRAGGRRFYRPRDIEILHDIKRMLHEDGMTIKEVQTLHGTRSTELGLSRSGSTMATTKSNTSEKRLKAALAALETAKRRLDGLLPRG